jgi:calcineurin-like phosphoesterase family protein
MAKRHLEIVKGLNGHKRLLRGNHDIFRTRDYLAAGFEEIAAYRVLDHILFSHIPIHSGSLERFRCNVHGHLHGNPAPYGKHINLCPEWRGYAPIPFEEIQQLVAAHEAHLAATKDAARMP